MADPISSVATPDPMLACNPVKEYFAPETGKILKYSVIHDKPSVHG